MWSLLKYGKKNDLVTKFQENVHQTAPERPLVRQPIREQSGIGCLRNGNFEIFSADMLHGNMFQYSPTGNSLVTVW